VSDLNVKSSEVYVQRRVNDLGARLNEGSRFRVLESTKSGHSRVVVLTRDLTDALVTHIESNTLGKNDLLFSKALVVAQDSQPSEADGTPDLFVADGREYAHGTVYAYTHGKCRCPECRNTMRRYRHKERGLKTVRKERVVLNVSGHLPRDTWRRIWKEAIEASGLEWSPRTHDLRHANATLLLKNGVDLHEVKERLGHQSIRTTERYLHRIKAQQSKASDAVSEFL
jgi:integrase